MNNSTHGVTLYSGFILDLLECFEDRFFAKELRAMAPKIDKKDLTKPAPMKLYNDMCQWIEERVGTASIRKAGVAIGNRAVDQMIATGLIGASPAPLATLQALKEVASIMIQDPHGRGWEILEATKGRIVMRRTQTFNCMMQEGLLRAIVERADVSSPSAEHIACTRDGAEYCDYAVTWLCLT